MEELEIVEDQQEREIQTVAEYKNRLQQVGFDGRDIRTAAVLWTETMKHKSLISYTEIDDLIVRKCVKLTNILGLNVIILMPPLKYAGGAVFNKRRTQTSDISVKAVYTGDALKLRFDAAVLAETEGKIFGVSRGQEVPVIGIKITPGADSSQMKRAAAAEDGRWNYEEIAKNYIIKVAAGTYSVAHCRDLLAYLADAYRIMRVSAAAVSGLLNPALFSSLRKLYLMPPEPKFEVVGRPSADVLDIINSIGNVIDVKIKHPAFDCGNLYIALACKIMGDVSAARAYIATEKALRDRALFLAAARAKYIENLTTIILYKNIIMSKLAAAKYAKIERELQLKPQLFTDSNNVLALLTPADKEIVLTEHRRRIARFEALRNNTCKHVALMRRFRFGRNEEKIAAAWVELSSYIPAAGGRNEMLQCTKCKFEIICPHIKLRTELDLKRAPMIEIKTKLTPYFADVVANGSYYCKICGEVISSIETFKDLGGKEIEMEIDEETANVIWHEFSSILKMLKFTAVINTAKLISSGRSAIYPHIFDIEKSIAKSKTNTADDMRNKKKLAIIIHAYAWIAHMALSSDSIEFKDLKIPGKNQVAAALAHCFSMLIKTRNNVIRDIPGMTNDIVKGQLVTAYKAVSGEVKTEDFKVVDEDPETTLRFDPIFKYIYVIAGRGPREKRTKNAAEVLKMDIPEYIDSPNAYTKVQPIKVPNSSDYEKYRAVSYNYFIERIKANLTTASVYTYLSAAADSYALSAQHAEVFDQYDVINELENKVVMKKFADVYRAIGKPNTTAELNDSTRFDKYIHHAKYSRLFDENGDPHKWTIVDGVKECAVCKTKFDDVDSLDEEKVRESLRAKYIIGNFFRFYETRCPEKTVHEYVKGVCSCGMKPEFTNSPSSAYYRKYRAKYAADYKEFMESSSSYVEPVEIIKDYPDPKWNFNYNKVLELSELVKLKPAQLNYLGSCNSQMTYADLVSGAYIPPEDERGYATRPSIILGYIRQIIIGFNSLRYYYRIQTPHPDIVALVDANIQKHLVQQLPELMPFPAAAENVDNNFTWFRKNKKARDLTNFCTQTFCEICLQILAIKGGAAKLAAAFVKYILAKIIRSETLLTKAGYFNWSTLYDDAYVSKVDDDTAEVDDDSEDNENPFKGVDDFDMDLEGADPEDVNLVKVGEEYGLD